MPEGTELTARFMRQNADRLRRMASTTKSSVSSKLRRIAHEINEHADQLERPINEERLDTVAD
jgi:hypothetical protein